MASLAGSTQNLVFRLLFACVVSGHLFKNVKHLNSGDLPEKLDRLPKLALVQAQDHVRRRAGSQVPSRCTFDWKRLGAVDERPMGQLREVEFD